MSWRVIKARIFIENPSLRGNRELMPLNTTLTRLENRNCHSWEYCYTHFVVVRFPRNSLYVCIRGQGNVHFAVSDYVCYLWKPTWCPWCLCIRSIDCLAVHGMEKFEFEHYLFQCYRNTAYSLDFLLSLVLRKLFSIFIYWNTLRNDFSRENEIIVHGVVEFGENILHVPAERLALKILSKLYPRRHVACGILTFEINEEYLDRYFSGLALLF